MARKFIQNIVGSSSPSSLARLGSPRTVNMFVETIDQGEHWINQVVRSIPGYKKVCDIEGNCRGLYTVSNGYDGKPKTYAVFDDKLYLLRNNKTPYEIATIGTAQSPVHFAETGNREGFHAHLVLVDGFYCYAVDTQIAPANQKEDFCNIQLPYTDFDRGVTIKPSHVAYLYGYLVVNASKTDEFYVSYQFPFERNGSDNQVDKNIFQIGSAEWGNKGQSLQAYWSPDNTTALVANGSRLYTFGDRSFQMFQYSDDLNVPFVSPDTAASPIGLKAVNTLCQLGTTVAFLGSSDLGNNGVYVIQGGTEAKRISTPEIEREIASYKTVKDAVGQIWQSNQHIFYCISFPAADKTWCYDLTENSWSERCTINEKNVQTIWRYQYATMNSEGKIWQSYNGGIAEQDPDNWTEHDGNPILRLRSGAVQSAANTEFSIDSIDIQMNNGQSEHIPDRPVNVMMRFSADGTSWSDFEVLEVGSVGQYDYDAVFYDFGMAHVFQIELSSTDNFPFALYGLKVQAVEVSY